MILIFWESFILPFRNALEIKKWFRMREGSQDVIEERRRSSEDHLVRRDHYGDAAVVVTGQLHIGESSIFSELTVSHFDILFKVIVSKTEDRVVHSGAGCSVV